MSKAIYLDNNGTTKPYPQVKSIMSGWLNKPINPSAANNDAKKADIVINDAIELFKTLNFTTTHDPIFTSGASESNNFIIRSVVDTWYYLKVNNIKSKSDYINETLKLDRPRIVSSTIEHSSILDCLNTLFKSKRIDLTYIQPDIHGRVETDKVKKVLSLRNGIILFTFIFANNELGTINDIGEIMGLVKEHSQDIVTHTDAVQIYGKMRLNLPGLHLDSCSVSFHKFGGIPGTGLLMLDKSVSTRYNDHLQPQISGKQQNSLRGGTLSVANISSMTTATIITHENRDKKNAKILKQKTQIIQLLSKVYPFIEYKTIVTQPDIDKKPPCTTTSMCILGYQQKSLFNTILLAIVEPSYEFCNVKFKKALLDVGIIVSIGSACNTSSKSASHVLQGISAPPIIKRGVLRISLGDNTTDAEVKQFCAKFIKLLKSKYIKDPTI
jgi:cysteine desulfurase